MTDIPADAGDPADLDPAYLDPEDAFGHPVLRDPAVDVEPWEDDDEDDVDV